MEPGFEVTDDDGSIKVFTGGDMDDDANFIPKEQYEEEQRVQKLTERNEEVSDVMNKTGMDKEELSNLFFTKVHAKHGDGFRLPMTIAERDQIQGLNLSEEDTKLLEEAVVHYVASDFINDMAKRRASTFSANEHSRFLRYAEEVINDPYKVFEYDDWLEGDETTASPSKSGKDPEEILRLARKQPWFDASVYSGGNKEYK